MVISIISCMVGRWSYSVVKV